MITSPEFPGYERFFHFKASHSNRGLWANLEMGGYEDVPFSRGEEPPGAAFTAKWAMGGRRPLDIVGTTYATPTLISGRIRDLLVSEGVTGWTTWPCRLTSRDGEPYDYHLLGITGRCERINWSRSEVFTVAMPGGPSVHLRGMYFDESSWDGSDLFVAGDTLFRMMTERVRKLLSTHKATNFEITRLTEVETWSVSVGFTPPVSPTMH